MLQALVEGPRGCWTLRRMLLDTARLADDEQTTGADRLPMDNAVDGCLMQIASVVGGVPTTDAGVACMHVGDRRRKWRLPATELAASGGQIWVRMQISDGDAGAAKLIGRTGWRTIRASSVAGDDDL
ncbi:hypothetical protein ACLOJK_038939 [Asimina triloba]